MSNVRQVYDRHGRVVHTYMSGEVDYAELADRHSLPLLDVDTDDGNRVIRLVESIPCSCDRGRTSRAVSAWAGPGGRCERCGGTGVLMGKGEVFEAVTYDAPTAERWRSQMFEDGRHRYWIADEGAVVE